MERPHLARASLPPLRGGGEEILTSFAGEVRGVYRDFLERLEVFHRAGGGGLETSRACSDAVEAIVVHLYRSLLADTKLDPARAPALVALGGFGRRELSPASDVDLLFVPGRGGDDDGGFTGHLVRLMWDAGLRLGHSVRTMAELRKAIRRDLDLRTAVLDSRLVSGDDAARSRLAVLREEVLTRDRGGFLEAKLGEATRRWEKYGGSYHLIEPNVKESPGGLRDWQTIRWLGTALPWKGTLTGLYRLSLVDRTEIVEIRRAFDFLVRVRNELHFRAQSDWNVLTLEVQREAAAGLGYVARGDLLAVERFMRDYYSRTRLVYAVLERLFAETRGRGNLRVIDGVLYRRVGAPGLGRLDLRLLGEKIRQDPLFMFKAQLETGRLFSPRMERRVRTLYRTDRLDPAGAVRMRESFLELLCMPGRQAPVLRSMHELGVLRHLVPPFERLRCLKRYDLYHQYTADEHSLQAVAALDALESETGLLARLYGEVAEKTELLLATLLHDIGKTSARGHALAGARMAEKILARFPLSTRSRELVVFLVRNHLLLSHFSQRRDMDDPDTAAQFVKRVRSGLNLKLLYLLTYADLRATGVGVWTDWKASLLEGLYDRASALLADRRRAGAAWRSRLDDRRRKIVAAAGGEAERARMAAHLDSLPARYAGIVTPARAREHLAMIDELEGRAAVVRFRRLRHVKEITVLTRDRPFRLSQLCGVLTVNDLDIRGAWAFTRRDGVVIDRFHVARLDGSVSLGAEDRRRLEADLDAALSGGLDLDRAVGLH
ncbi:MAG: HD domain-containing protein, partial [Candidatus Krumholzibacteriota bacterium]|nr:HD domain-containing protein [Candidatus Krumholzibacteriota bacterium]